jgi:hypothetical protein
LRQQTCKPADYAGPPATRFASQLAKMKCRAARGEKAQILAGVGRRRGLWPFGPESWHGAARFLPDQWTRQNDQSNGSNNHATDLKTLLRRRIGPACMCRPGPRQLAATLGTGLGDRPLRRLFRHHFGVLHCLPRPFVVAGALIVFAAVLETLQALTPDRWANPWAAFYSACGVMAAALIADVSIRAWTRFQLKRAQKPSL